jgi:hypothetical protein
VLHSEVLPHSRDGEFRNLGPWFPKSVLFLWATSRYFYIPEIKLAFELNGIFHYEPIYGTEKLNQIQNNDNRKFQACLEKEIELCVIDTSWIKHNTLPRMNKVLDIVEEVIKKSTTVSNEFGGTRTHNLHLKRVLFYHWITNSIIWLNIQLSMFSVVSQPLLKSTTETVVGHVVCASFRIGTDWLGSRSPTDSFNIAGFGSGIMSHGHLRNCHKVTKKGRKLFGFSPLLLLCLNDLFVHKSKRGLARNMPAWIQIGIATKWICKWGFLRNDGHLCFTSVFYL